MTTITTPPTCVFCGSWHTSLVAIQTGKVFVVCWDCGANGPQGSTNEEALEKYSQVRAPQDVYSEWVLGEPDPDSGQPVARLTHLKASEMPGYYRGKVTSTERGQEREVLIPVGRRSTKKPVSFII